MAEDTSGDARLHISPELEAFLVQEGALLRGQGHVIQIMLAIMAKHERPVLEANLRMLRIATQKAKMEGRAHSGLDAAAELLARGLGPADAEFPAIRLISDGDPEPS